MTDIVETYVDQIALNISPYGVTYILGATSPGEPQKPNPRVVLRMSHSTAKIVAMLTRKHMKVYERENQVKTQVPFVVMEDMKLAEEDW